MPVRIQRRRVKGWRMPEGAVYVGRPTRWGNDWKPSGDRSAADCVAKFRAEWEQFISEWPDVLPRLKRNLGGKNLVCWCPLDQPCHADVLLELANQPSHESGG